MGLVLRTLRNLWFRDIDGVMSKSVDDEETLVGSVDFSDQLETNQSIESATFDDVSGVTLGTPTISGGVVEFTHLGTGSAVLQVVLNFVAYLASLYTSYTSTPGSGYLLPYHLNLYTAGGVGASAGEAAFFVIKDALSADVAGLDGLYAVVHQYDHNTEATFVPIKVGPLVWDAGEGAYSVVLLEDFPADLDSGEDRANLAVVTAMTPDDHAAAVALCAARPARILRASLRFVDPRNYSDDYS